MTCASCLHLGMGRFCWHPAVFAVSGRIVYAGVKVNLHTDHQCEHFEDRLTKESRAMLETRCPQE